MPVTRRTGGEGAPALIPRYRAVLLAVCVLSACSQPAPDAPAELRDSMHRFVDALLRQDATAFAAHFPRQEPWRYVGTLTTPHAVSLIEPGVLARDLAAREGLYELLFYSSVDDTFRNYVEMTAGADWQVSGAWRFSPPGLPDLGGSVYVQWRREGERWVVDTIAEPGA